MRREYTYSELCRMKKKMVIRLAGYRNIKAALNDGINKNIDANGNIAHKYLSKKYIARIIASDR